MNPLDILATQTTTLITDFVRNQIVTKIVDYVNSTDDEITTDIIMKYLSLPEVKSYSNTGSNSTYHKKSTTFSSSNTKFCIWEYKRGKSKGDLCDKPVVEGHDYCSSCLKRPILLTSKKTDSLNNRLSTKNMSVEFPKSRSDDTISLDVLEYDKEKGLYIDIHNNFMLHISDKNIVYAIGKHDPSTKITNMLTDEEKNIAKDEGYEIYENAEDEMVLNTIN